MKEMITKQRRRRRLDYQPDLDVFKCRARNCFRPTCVLIVSASKKKTFEPWRCPVSRYNAGWRRVGTLDESKAVAKSLLKHALGG